LKIRLGTGQRPFRHRGLAAAALIASVAVLANSAASASAASIVNGGFETGNLNGWLTQNGTPNGTWFARAGTESPISKHSVLAPFQGTYDALSDESSTSSTLLYQDVALEPGYSHQLSLELNYHSYVPIAIPTPDTLEVTSTPPGPGEVNQQVRVDVMKAGSPVASLNQADILATLYATKEGDPEAIGWTNLTADLTPFAGQTVRIRIAAVDNSNFLNVGVDSVAINGVPAIAPPAPAPIVIPAPVVEAHCVVPKLQGKKLKAAKKKIRAADCKVGLVSKKEGVKATTGKVVKQSPKPGKVLPAKTGVSVKLG
jgi:hypothetical protein